MKITSDNGKEYKTIEEAQKADIEFQKAKEKKAIAEAEKKNAISKKKKELADKISEADKMVNIAYEDYETAKKHAKSIKDEATKRAKSILEDAEKQSKEILKTAIEVIENTTAQKMNLIKDFNNEFGVYTQIYTGDKATQEYNRMLKDMKDIFSFTDDFLFKPFRSFWW